MSGKEIIAIDGTAGSGKSTVARELAKRLSYRLVDSGSMYRAVTLLAIEREIDIDDQERLEELAKEVSRSFSFKMDYEQGLRIFLEGRDITELIRRPDVGALVSEVSAMPAVRNDLVRLQKRLLKEGKVVVEGRDIGTKVCTEAEVKVYLDASLEERVRRRQLHMTEQGLSVSGSEVEKEIRHRDSYDSTREHSPLVPSQDSYRIDTTKMTIEEVVERVMGLWRKMQSPDEEA